MRCCCCFCTFDFFFVSTARVEVLGRPVTDEDTTERAGAELLEESELVVLNDEQRGHVVVIELVVVFARRGCGGGEELLLFAQLHAVSPLEVFHAHATERQRTHQYKHGNDREHDYDGYIVSRIPFCDHHHHDIVRY